MLEGIVRKCASSAPAAPDRKQVQAFLADMGADPKAVEALFARAGSSGGKQPCKICAKIHTGKCFVKMLIDGETPLVWEKLNSGHKKELVEIAKRLKPDGQYPTVAM